MGMKAIMAPSDEKGAAFAQIQRRETTPVQARSKVSSWLGVIAVALLASAAPVGAQATELSGAGATFPYPIYAKWAEAYKAKTGVSLNYQSIGSGGGIKQIIAKTVDFGASDMPLKPEDLDKNGVGFAWSNHVLSTVQCPQFLFQKNGPATVAPGGWLRASL